MNIPLARCSMIAITVVVVMCLIELLDRSLHLELFRYGVYPRSLPELANILAAPLVHGSWYHLLSNSFTLLVLLTMLLYAYPRSALAALVLIYIGSGTGVWLFARESYHYGASGLNHGLMFYLFTSGILRRDRLSIALAMIVFFLYGSMIWTIFPQEPGISYESHFFGAATGLLGAFLFSRRDPLPATKHYDWEDDEPGDDGEH
ncbi:MAG: rhomboid family intramembrane serine protease [Gammaproteobacteria bacterium]